MDFFRLGSMSSLPDLYRFESYDLIDALKNADAQTAGKLGNEAEDSVCRAMRMNSITPMGAEETSMADGQQAEKLVQCKKENAGPEALQELGEHTSTEDAKGGFDENSTIRRSRRSKSGGNPMANDFLSENDPDYHAAVLGQGKAADEKNKKLNERTSAGVGGHRDGKPAKFAGKSMIRREKNRVAAQKCRAKKLASMIDMEAQVRKLSVSNEEMRVQLLTIQKMLSREVKLRECLKVVLHARCTAKDSMTAANCSANDVIVALESGTLDMNRILQSLGATPEMLAMSSQMVGGTPPMTALEFLPRALPSDEYSTGTFVLPSQMSVTSMNNPAQAMPMLQRPNALDVSQTCGDQLQKPEHHMGVMPMLSGALCAKQDLGNNGIALEGSTVETM